MSLNTGKTKFTILVCYSTDFLSYVISTCFRPKILVNFCCDLINGLSCSPGKTYAFSSSNEPNAKKIEFIILRVLVHWIFFDTWSRIIWSKIFMDICYDLINDVTWLEGKNVHIFKFKQVPKRKDQVYHFLCVIVHGFLVIRDPDLFLAKLLHERRLRPYWWQELV